MSLRPEVIAFVAGHPSVDRLYEVEHIRPGSIHRPALVRVVPGGKGLNAARAARLLGGNPHVLAILAGHAGRWIADALHAEGVEGSFVWTEGETRTSVSVASPDQPAGSITGFYEQSEPISASTWSELEAIATDVLARSEVVCLSGGVIAGAPIDAYRRMAEIAHASGVPVAIDSHGPHLLSAFEVGPELIKLNAEEAAEALDIAAPDDGLLHWAAEAAAEIKRRVPGNQITVVTCGTSGMALVDDSGEMLGGRIDEIGAYPVGSGDAALASLALGLSRSLPPRVLLAQALAAGAANAEVPGPGVLDPNRILALAARASTAPIRG
jgi:1-phosphofructokinase family hexose kinase